MWFCLQNMVHPIRHRRPASMISCIAQHRLVFVVMLVIKQAMHVCFAQELVCFGEVVWSWNAPNIVCLQRRRLNPRVGR